MTLLGGTLVVVGFGVALVFFLAVLALYMLCCEPFPDQEQDELSEPSGVQHDSERGA